MDSTLCHMDSILFHIIPHGFDAFLFGRTDPFWPHHVPFFDLPTPSCPQCIPFWTHRPLLAVTHPVLYAPTPPCPFCPDFGLADPFWPQCVPFLDAPTPTFPELTVFGCTDPIGPRIHPFFGRI